VISFNAPYLTKTEAHKTSLAYEPQLALTPTGKPTSLIEQLLRQAPTYLAPTGIILLEIGYNQAQAVKKIAHKYFPHAQITVKQDLGGFDRLITCDLS
jgi:release factor glutamine methyltransferase